MLNQVWLRIKCNKVPSNIGAWIRFFVVPATVLLAALIFVLYVP